MPSEKTSKRKKWTLERRAGYPGSGIGKDVEYFRWKWAADFNAWTYTTLNLFPGHISASVYRTENIDE